LSNLRHHKITPRVTTPAKVSAVQQAATVTIPVPVRRVSDSHHAGCHKRFNSTLLRIAA